MATPHATCSVSLRVRRSKSPRLAVLLFVLENKTLIHPTSELLKTNDLDIEVGALVSCRLKEGDFDAKVLYLTETREEADCWDDQYWADLSESESSQGDKVAEPVKEKEQETAPVPAKAKPKATKATKQGTKCPTET